MPGSNRTRLRGQARRRNAPYPLAELPPSLAVSIGRNIVHRLAVGQANISGDDFGGIFADAIGGEHRSKPLGIADVVWDDCAWSVKTIQEKKPFTKKIVRLISGRNSPIFAEGIDDFFADIQATGASVLNVWNARVNESLNQHSDLRVFVMIRNMSTLEFTLFEFEAVRYVPAHYEWRLNKKRNFEGFDIVTGDHVFTWQSHGSQFTVKHHVPPSAYRFRINRMPTILEKRRVLQIVNFRDDWIEPVATL